MYMWKSKTRVNEKKIFGIKGLGASNKNLHVSAQVEPRTLDNSRYLYPKPQMSSFD